MHWSTPLPLVFASCRSVFFFFLMLDTTTAGVGGASHAPTLRETASGWGIVARQRLCCAPSSASCLICKPHTERECICICICICIIFYTSFPDSCCIFTAFSLLTGATVVVWRHFHVVSAVLLCQ